MDGRLAQPGERLVYTEKVGGSIPSAPTTNEADPAIRMDYSRLFTGSVASFGDQGLPAVLRRRQLGDSRACDRCVLAGCSEPSANPARLPGHPAAPRTHNQLRFRQYARTAWSDASITQMPGSGTRLRRSVCFPPVVNACRALEPRRVRSLRCYRGPTIDLWEEVPLPVQARLMGTMMPGSPRACRRAVSS